MLYLPPTYLSALESHFGLGLQHPVPKTLKPFARTISEMSSGLKKGNQRHDFISSAYLDEKKFCDAYLLYYTTCNVLKMVHPLGELRNSGFFDTRSDLRVLDLGSGTGTMILGLSLWLAEYFPTTKAHFTAWDQSAPALRTFEEFFKRFEWKYSLHTLRTDLENTGAHDEKYDLITGGNVLNELTGPGEEQFAGILEKNLLPGGFVILIEPALRMSSRRLLEFRDRLLQRGWFVYVPCFTGKNCPALTDPKDWCHHDVPWERPQFIAIMDEMAGHIRKSLKFSYLILSRQDIHLSDFVFSNRNFTNQFRVVSDLFKEKGRRRIFLCNDLGRCECLKNNRDDSMQNKAFDELELYDIVQTDGLAEKTRHKQIEKETVVKRFEEGS